MVQQWCRCVVEARWFEPFIIGVIVLNAVLLGCETVPFLLTRYGAQFELLNTLIISIFVVEVLIKLGAASPQWWRYFTNGWNVFDFTVVVVTLLPATGPFATLIRLLRLLRVVRLVSALPELRLIVATLIRSIPSMGNVLVLMGIIFYIYAIAGYHLFHAIDPQHWGNLPLSFLTLFRVVTLEDWTDVMYTAMEAMPWAWLYFVSFVVMGTFVVMNLFIAVVLNNLDEAKTERLAQLRQIPSRDELVNELRQTQDILAKLQSRLSDYEGPNPKA